MPTKNDCSDIAGFCLNLYDSPLSRRCFLAKMFPGYSGLVKYGRWYFLAIALGFPLLLNIFLIVNFYWAVLITTTQRNILLIVLFGAWVALTLVASFLMHKIASLKPEEQDETLRQTICHYLRGDWFAAEAQILPYVKKFPKDVEMLLLQATMYRRTERPEEALLVLDKLQLLQDSRYWHREIETERSLITAAMQTSKHIAEFGCQNTT